MSINCERIMIVNSFTCQCFTLYLHFYMRVTIMIPNEATSVLLWFLWCDVWTLWFSPFYFSVLAYHEGSMV